MSDDFMRPSDDQVGLGVPAEWQSPRRSTWWLWPTLILVAIVNAGLIVAATRIKDEAIKSELVNFAGTGLVLLPLMPLVTLAQLGNRSGTARLFTIAYWGLFAIVSLALVAIFTFSGVFNFAMAERLAPDKVLDAVAPGGLSKVGFAAALGMLAIILGLFVFSESGRTLAARFLPFDPSSFSSTTGLASVIVLLAVSLIPLIILNQPPLLLLFENTKALQEGPALSADIGVHTLYYQLIWAVPFAIIAAGFPLTRRFGEAMERLGVGKISMIQFAIAVGVAVGMVALMQVLGPAVDKTWTWMDWPKTDEKAFNELIKSTLTGAGAIAIGITAGVCEELAFRGLLQPRVGLLLSNLLFAAVHAFQYHWDALFIVFIIGLVCGIVRKRINTTASIIVHGLYDTLVVLAMTFKWFE